MSTPELKPVKSSAIAALGYDPASRELHVQYKGGGAIYIFSDVSPELHAKLGQAESVGRFVENEVKPGRTATKKAG